MPQWNCHCPNCAAVRAGTLPSRLQVCAAFSPDGASWYLINATPDVVTQLAYLPKPSEAVRQTPIAGVILTDGELDHTLGLLHLREGAGWTLYATEAVRGLLETSFPVLPALRKYVADAAPQTLSFNQPLVLGEGDAKVCIHLFETGRDLPRYAGGGETAGAVIALRFETKNSTLVYAPGVGELTSEFRAWLEPADIILFDGTLYTNDELSTLGISETTARDMGHVPMSGEGGSAQWLAELPAKTKRYIHINNTNPALEPNSEARKRLRELGLELAEDGWEVQL